MAEVVIGKIIIGLTNDDSPIGRIVASDELATEQLMVIVEDLPVRVECSIVGHAKVRKAEVTGQTLRIIEEIISKE